MSQDGRQLRPYDPAKIRQAQDRLGWTDERLARVAGVHPATVGRVRRGITQKRSTIMALANAMGLSLAEVMRPANVMPGREAAS